MKFRWRPRRGWIRFLAKSFLWAIFGLVILVITLWTVVRQPRVASAVFSMLVQSGLNGPMEEPKLETSAVPPAGLADPVSVGSERYALTNVWEVRLSFSSNEWATLSPQRVPPLKEIFRRDGQIVLRNPAASRPGIAGAMGIDLPWSTGTVAVAGTSMDRVAVRFKGNGTFLEATRSYRRSFKLDLNEHVPGRHWGGRKMLNLGNMGSDATAMREVLGYEVHERAGVPAPRAAYARVTLSVENRFQNRLLGLYAMVEDIDAAWVEPRFGKRGATVFKPVTYDLFLHLGDAWEAYDATYHPKTKLGEGDRERLIETARFFTTADEAEFARRLGEFFDVDEVARFLACQVLLSNYDGILGTGQNMLLYLDARTRRFGLAPWDLDQGWGVIGFAGTAEQRVKASLWHPWMGRNSFLERLYRVEDFRVRYRAALEAVLDQWFRPEYLEPRMDAISRTVRPFLAEEDAAKAARHDLAVGAPRSESDAGAGEGTSPDAPQNLKRFVRGRVASARAQLEGREVGEIIRMQTFW